MKNVKALITLIAFLNMLPIIVDIVFLIMYFHDAPKMGGAVIVGIFSHVLFSCFICQSIRDDVWGEDGVPGPFTCMIVFLFGHVMAFIYSTVNILSVRLLLMILNTRCKMDSVPL